MELTRYLDAFTERDWQAADDSAGPVRFAMVGLGWWVREWAIPAVADSDFCETTVLVSRDEAAAASLAGEVDTVESAVSTEQFREGAAGDDYDAVYVCTPNATHLPYVEAAADAGKAVLCEKPMEATVERAEKMVAAAREAGVTLMVAYRMHTEPAVRRVREMLGDGLLGQPVQVHGHMSQPLLDMIEDPNQWRLDPKMAGRGATVTDIGLYPLNTARFLLDSDPVAVEATMRSEDEAFDEVPDQHAAFTMEFADGTQAVCTASQQAAQSSHITVVGTEGSASVEPAFFPDEPRQLTVSRGGTTVETTFEQIDQMREEFDYFADCLLSERKPTGDGEHGLVDMRVMDAIYDAAEDGRRIEL